MPVLKKVLRNVLREPLSKATPAPVYAPDLDLKFAEELRLDPRVDFSRGSNATVVDSDGTLKWAGHNIAYKSGNTRLIVDTNTSLTAAPDGTNTADLIFPNSTSNTHEWAHTNNSVSGETYRAVVYGKHHSGDYRLGIRGFGNGGTGAFPIFDLADGEVDQTGSAFSNATITDIGNGWYKCEATTTATAIFGLSISVVDSTGAHSFSGDEATGFFVWGGHVYRADKSMQQRTDVATGLETYYPTTSAAYYAPRFDHDPATDESLGLLIEESRTNLDTNSETLEDWDFTQASADSTSQESPDGLTNAVLLKEFASTSTHLCYFTISVTSGQAQTFSTFAKRNGRDLQLCFGSSDVAGDPYANFNLSSGEISGTSGSITATIEDYGNGWFRCSATADAASTNTSFQVVLGLIDTTNPTRLPSYLGDGSSGVYIWGTQIETNASFPTSYIPTSGSSVTRSADVASIATSAFGFSEVEGTLFTEAQTFVHNNSHRVLSISDGTTSNRIIMQAHTTNHLFVGSGGATQAALDAGRYYSNQYSKHSAAYQENNFAACLDGGTVATDSLGTIPTVNIMNIGAGATGNFSFLNGHLKQFTYYARRLDDATLQALTQPSLEPSLNLVFDSSETSYVNTGLTR